MVGITKRLLITAALIFAATLGCAAQSGLGTFAERQQRQLSKRAERVAALLVQTRQAYYQSPSDSLSLAIYELEQQQKSIREAIARLKSESDNQTNTSASSIGQETAEMDKTGQSTHNKIVVSDNLAFLFRTSSRRYNLITSEINTLIENYAATHNRAIESVDKHDNATSMKELEGHYSTYKGALDEASRISAEIAKRGERLLTSKTNSLFGFADSLKLDTVRSQYTLACEKLEEKIADSLGQVTGDVELAMFAHRLRLTMCLEAEMARYIQPHTADSLKLLAEEFDANYTTFAIPPKPKRVEGTKYSGVKVSKKPKYVSVSSLPTIKVPSDGELYAISVGNYQSLPSSTKPFKGTSPLHRELREDGRTYIYVGLYPTSASAKEDINRLKELGFKQPELVMWRNGIRRDDFVDRSSAPSPATKQSLYRIEIAGATGILSDVVLEVISAEAPRKEISKYTASNGSMVYTLGIFTQESEAHKIASAIGSADSTLTVTVNQIGKK